MGFRDGEFGDILAETMVRHFLNGKYSITPVACEIRKNRIKIMSYQSLDELHKDQCMRVKTHYIDPDDVYHNVLEFDYEYFLGEMLDWFKGR